MSFRIELSRKAARDIAAHYDWLAARSATAADRWRSSLLTAVSSLTDNPERCPEAPEAEWHAGLRQLDHGKRRSVFRIIFKILGNRVYIARVRHAAQDLLGPDDV